MERATEKNIRLYIIYYIDTVDIMISLPVSYIIFCEEYHLVIFCLNKCNPKFITQLIFVCTNAIYDGYHTRYQHVTKRHILQGTQNYCFLTRYHTLPQYFKKKYILFL